MKADEKKCPQCAEVIKLDAKMCRHCGHQFSNEEITDTKARNKNRTGIGCVTGLVLLFLVGYCASKLPPPAPAGNQAGDGNLSALAEEGKPAKPASRWQYSESKDEMRGTTTRFAEVTSDNETQFDFPYHGGSTLTLQVRRRPEDGLNILASISKGQFLCNSFTNTTVAVKFDDGPIQRYRCTDTSSHDSDVIFISPPAKFLAALRKSKKVTIEPEFFQAGRRQFSFTTAGLEWK